MTDSNFFSYLRSSILFALALAPLGCTIVVGDQVGGGDAGEDMWEKCYDQYDECMNKADGEKVLVEACGEQLDACTSAGQDDPTGGQVGGSASGGGDGAPPAEEICVSLHKACVAEADSAAETLACEQLFDHCAHPGMCEAPCDHGCPEAALDGCLGDYAGCVKGASKDYEVEACGVVFHGCVDELGPECLPADDAQTDACLAEHALCTACAADDAELAACEDVFDACMSPPM